MECLWKEGQSGLCWIYASLLLLIPNLLFGSETAFAVVDCCELWLTT